MQVCDQTIKQHRSKFHLVIARRVYFTIVDDDFTQAYNPVIKQ